MSHTQSILHFVSVREWRNNKSEERGEGGGGLSSLELEDRGSETVSIVLQNVNFGGKKDATVLIAPFAIIVLFGGNSVMLNNAPSPLTLLRHHRR